MSLNELRGKRKAAMDSAKAIRDAATKENRDLSEEESAELERSLAEAKEARAQIEAIERRQLLLSEVDQQVGWDSSSPGRISTPASVREPEKPGSEARPNPWRSFGEFMQAVYRAGLPDREPDQRLFASASGMNESVDSEGGFLVQKDFSTAIMQRVYDTGQILSRCDRAQITGNSNGLKVPYVKETSRATGSRLGGVQAYWAPEAGTVTPSKPALGVLELKLHKLMSIGYTTDELLADAGGLETILVSALSDEIIFTAEDAVVRGTGAGQPKGILKSDALITVSKEAGQTAGTIWGPNILKMYNRLPARNRRNACWLVNQDCEPYLFALAIAGVWGSGATQQVGLPIYLPAGTPLNTGDVGTLLGRPVVPVEYCCTCGTVGDIILTDLGQYLIADKSGIESAVSMHVRFLYGENAFRLTYRIDGQPKWQQAVTPYQGNTTVSPFVALESRT